MAKFKWWNHRFGKADIKIFHFGRRLGKTRKMFEEMLRGSSPTAFILSPGETQSRYCSQQFTDYLREMDVEYSTDRRESLVRCKGRRYSFNSADRMARDFERRHVDRSVSEFYMDNIENMGNGDERSLAQFVNNLLRLKLLKVVTLTGNHFSNRYLEEIFFEKILAKNRKSYYNKHHEETTYNRYINLGTFSSRTDADAELRPRSLLAS